MGKLELIVTPTVMRGISPDGFKLSTRCIFLEHEGETKLIWEINTFCDITSVKIIILSQEHEPKFVKLPKSLSDTIVYYLENYHEMPDMTFDCRTFANMTMGVDRHEWKDYRDNCLLADKPSLLKTGDVVYFLSNGKANFHHAAVYLENDLFISVAGAGGCIVISTESTMLEEYRADRVWLARGTQRRRAI